MVARAPDPHNLRELAQHAQRAAAPIIDTNRRCKACGYNLRGLRYGVNCPECGLSSALEFTSDDPLSQMPLRVIFAVVRGCWVSSACVLSMVALLLIDRFGVLNHALSMTMLAGLSCVWCGAVLWLTPALGLPQAISRGFGKRSRTRIAARWLQLGWVLATCAAAAQASLNSPSAAIVSALQTAQTVGIVVGLAGLVVLSVLLERLADWARDEDAQRMFNWAMWSWPIAILLYAPIQYFIGSWLAFTGRPKFAVGVFVILWVLAICTFPYGLLMLAKSVTLSILHNLEYQDRQRRRLERNERFMRQAGDLASRTEPQPMRGGPPSPRTR
jgi:small-conductance mechanosensitive channel